MKVVGSSGGSNWRQTTVLTAVEAEWVVSSPVVVGSGEAIVGGQLTIAS